MNTSLTKFILPLAALALGSVACDPFPEAPGGAPAIVRVVTYGGALGASNTVETVTGGNTVSTDFAQPDEIIRIQFNKPMLDSSIQKYPDYNPDGTTFVPPGGADICTPADGLDVSDFPAGTLVCSDPTSSTDGGSAVIYPGAPLAYGTTYNVAGTVRDYEGNPLTLNVSITVDPRPLPFGQDGYSAGIDWFDSGTATSYDLLWAPDVSGAPGTFLPLAAGLLPVDVCDAGTCFFLDTELAPDTSYWYRVIENTATTPITRPAAVSSGTTLHALTPTLGVVSTPTVPPTVIAGVLRVAWGTIQGVSAYTVEQSSDGGTTWAVVATQTLRTYYAGTPPPSTTAPTTGPGTLTSGTTYSYRVTPAYTSGFAAVKGNVASKVAP